MSFCKIKHKTLFHVPLILLGYDVIEKTTLCLQQRPLSFLKRTNKYQNKYVNLFKIRIRQQFIDFKINRRISLLPINFFLK